MKKWLRFSIVFLLSFILGGCGTKELQVPIEKTIGLVNEALESIETENTDETSNSKGEDEEFRLENEEFNLAEDGIYSSKEDVARYLYLYGHLPSNFIMSLFDI